MLGDGTFVSVGITVGPNAQDPATVWASTDEGQTWTERASIPVEMNLPSGEPYSERYTHRGLNRLPDDTLREVAQFVGPCGRAAFAKIQGFTAPIMMIGGMTGPLLAGVLYDARESYTLGFTIVAALQLLAAFTIFFAKPTQPPQQALPKAIETE